MLQNQQPVGRNRGFTLVELLLAITLMSILLALTYSGLRAASRSSERGEALLAAGGGNGKHMPHFSDFALDGLLGHTGSVNDFISVLMELVQ